MRRRILVAIVGVAAGSLVLLALPLAVAVDRLYRDDEVIKLERTATEAARQFDAGAEPGDPVEFPPGSDSVAAYDRSGARIGGEGPPRADPIVAETIASGEVSDGEAHDRLIVAVPVLGDERVAGAVRASRSTDALSDRVLRTRLIIGGLALAAIALAAGAALYLSRRLTDPIDELAASAGRLGEGDFSTRAPRRGISELDALANALDVTAQRLAELINRERAFSANASHQLRTPLAALRLELESRMLAAGEADELVTRSLAQVERLESTIDTMLAAARDIPSPREPFEPAAVLEEIRLGWHERLATEGRALRVSIDDDIPLADAAPPVVREILEVLVTNAWQHGAGTVSVRARASSGQLAIEVADEGAGIGSATDDVFAARSSSAGGVGLALARSLAEAEGGRLTLSRAAPEPLFTLLLRGGGSHPDEDHGVNRPS